MELTFNIDAPLDSVYEYLTDMQKFVAVHPVINKIDRVLGNNYLVHETLKFCGIPFAFTYPATIAQNYNDRKIQMHASVMRLTKIEMNYTLSANNNMTTVNETITFSSPLPIKRIMAGIFKKQHTLLFKNIDDAV
ncbi:hypothetical protein GCM10023149_43330 [Mucilaginibacter gynuensis]|uniref:SRPBCC family protein n=1 Tax=Mucilaginibacter gynuensis TaxID=1302236 RepID=A0ABP8H7D0_9SPHI